MTRRRPDDTSRRYHRAARRRERFYSGSGGLQTSDSQMFRPFGTAPNYYSHQLFKQVGPLLQGFGFNPSQGFENKLNNAQGPLADFIRGVRGFGPSVIPQAQDVGNLIAGQGQQSYDLLKGQVGSALGALPQFQQASAAAVPLAQQAATDAFSPIRSRALFQQTAQNMLEPIRQAAAARGLESSGAGQAREESALTNLGLGFAQNDQQNQQAALQGLQSSAANAAQLSAAGIPIAGAQMAGIPQLQAALSQRFQLPMQAAGSLLNLYLAGQTPGLANLGATNQFPVGQQSKGLTFCLPEDALILTPKGAVEVRALTLGDKVKSLDECGQLIDAEIAGFGSRPVPDGHTFVHVRLQSGETFAGSPGHPLPDGRPFSMISAGDRLEGHGGIAWTVVEVVEKPAHTRTTRDLLIDSVSGLYLLSPGVACASTLDLRHLVPEGAVA